MSVVRAGVRPGFPTRGVISAAIVIGLGTAPAYAAQPTLLIANAPIVTPSAALTYYGTPTSPTPPATRDPLIQEQARALRYDVDKIFAYVRDNVETVPMFGVQEGARGIVLNGRGTAFDQAQFMVEALREADAVAGTGYSPQYVLGTITVDNTIVSSWLNVTTGAQASRVLAAGGIPATVTGTGTSYTVTMLHPWVKVTISGTQYLFDPGLKTYTPRAGTSWQPSISYSQSTLLAAGGGGTGNPISNFNQSAFRTQLNSYRANVEGHLASNGVGKRADAILGARDIVVHPSSEDRRTTLPYVVSSDRTWTGQIPDKFRASFTVSLKVGNTTTAYNTYFADQVGGKAIGFGYTYSSATNSFSPILGGLPNPAPTLYGSTINGCDYYLNNQANAAAAVSAVIAIDHPYAATSGTYGDRTLTKQLATKACINGVGGLGGNFYVTNDWGYTGAGVSDRIKIQAARQRNEPSNKFNMIFAPTLASVARQYSQFLDTASWAQGNIYLLHDLIGLHTLDNVAQGLTNSPNCCTMATSLTMDFEGAVSALSASALAPDDTGAAFTAGFGLPLIEGSVPRQEQDAVYDMASLSLLTQQATRAGDSAAPVYIATNNSTWNSVQNSLTGYTTAAKSAIGAYIAEGYSVLVPKHGDLIEPHITVASVVTRTMSLLEDQFSGGELKRSAFFAWHPGAGGVPDKVAMLVYDPRRGRVLKAGVGVAIDSVEGTIRKPEAPKAESKDIIRAAINVDGKTGHLKYSPAPDLVDGVGEFPFSLSLQRAYDQTDPENYGFGIGWKHNWYQFATASNDGSSALGGGGAQALGSALVLITALGDLGKTADAQHLHAAAQAAAWFTDQTIDNSVVVASGLDGERSYFRQADGVTFASGSGDGTRLVQAGAPTQGIINRRLYYPVSFTLTDRDGSTRRYPTQTVVSGMDLSSPGIASIFSKKSLPMDQWSFPNGVVVNTQYFNTVATTDITGLSEVKNNLGAKINWPINSPYDYGQKGTFSQCELIGGTWTPVEYGPRPAKITFATSAGATMTVDMDAQVKQTNTPNNPPFSCTQGPNGGHLIDVESSPVSTTQTQWTSYANDMVDAAGKMWKYGKALTYGLYGTYYTLNAIYKPSQPNTPDVTLDYGDWANQHGDYNVRTLTDLGGNVWNYHTNPFRSEILSPLQNQATPKVGDVTLYDRYGQAVASIDAIGRKTTTVYDALGRVIQTIRPAGDSEVTTYDARGNTLTSSKRPVGGNGSTDLTTTYTYVVGPTVVTCTTPEATCNKLLSQTPPRGFGTSGFTTDYAWNSDGTLLSVTKPADMNGNRPQTTLSYSTGLNGTDGTPLKLLTGKTEKISSTISTTTNYTRDAANKFTVSAATVDSGGLNLRTCIKFDSAGNLISISDPRQGVCP